MKALYYGKFAELKKGNINIFCFVINFERFVVIFNEFLTVFPAMELNFKKFFFN